MVLSVFKRTETPGGIHSFIEMASKMIHLKTLSPLIAGAFVLAIGIGNVEAERIHLSNGSVIEGKILVEPKTSKELYEIETDFGVVLKLKKSQIKRIGKLSSIEQEYEVFRAAAGDDLEGHRKLEQWCRNRKGMSKKREYHLRSIVRLDPTDESARRSLGYEKRGDGKWMKRDEIQVVRGFVKVGSEWKLPETVVIEASEKKQLLTTRKWIVDTKRWRSWINKKRHDEALANFNAIKDVSAAPAIAALLARDKEVIMRRLYVEILSRLNSSVGANAIIKAAIQDPSDLVREDASDALAERSHIGIVRQISLYLNPKYGESSPLTINRAAQVLGQIGHPEAIEPLIDALVTEHVVKKGNTGGGDDVGASFGGPQDGSFVMGSKKGDVKAPSKNDRVRTALRGILGEDFGFDKQRWLEFLAIQNLPNNLDMRRTR